VTPRPPAHDVTVFSIPHRALRLDLAASGKMVHFVLHLMYARPQSASLLPAPHELPPSRSMVGLDCWVASRQRHALTPGTPDPIASVNAHSMRVIDAHHKRQLLFAPTGPA
jgi:hypothetical protein